MKDVKQWFNDTIQYCLSTSYCNGSCEREDMCDILHKTPGYKMINRQIERQKDKSNYNCSYSANFEDQPQNVQDLIRKLYLIKLVSK